MGDTKSATDAPTVPKLADANPAVVQIAIQDQWDRGNDMYGSRQIAPPDMHGETVASRDEKREATLRKLLEEGQVKSGTDFWLAALTFQHSPKSESVMLAHILAVTAATKGNANGKWLSAASLDRYLWDVNQAQIFGTQFKQDSKGKWTMEPYEPTTLSDAERAIWCVIPLGQQRTILKSANEGEPLGATDTPDCK